MLGWAGGREYSGQGQSNPYPWLRFRSSPCSPTLSFPRGRNSLPGAGALAPQNGSLQTEAPSLRPLRGHHSAGARAARSHQPLSQESCDLALHEVTVRVQSLFRVGAHPATHLGSWAGLGLRLTLAGQGQGYAWGWVGAQSSCNGQDQ